MKNKFFSVLKKHYQNLPPEASELIAENLISPFHITLPKAILLQAQNVTKELYHLRETKDYQKQILADSPATAQFDPGNKSICMSYDFHIDEAQNLKLIEVNTNAAFLLLGYYLYEMQGLPLPIADFSVAEIIANIKEEYQLAGAEELKKIIITDDKPNNQRLFIEFLVFAELFKKQGWQTEICDIAELTKFSSTTSATASQTKKSLPFIYNRFTDFYFNEQNSHDLKNMYVNKQAVVSPNPHEYALLADKSRLINWSNQIDNYQLKTIEPFLLRSFKVNGPISTELWAQRKKLFFKPMQSFGSKMSYRGESISKKLLEQLLQDEEILAQEYCPPPSAQFNINDERLELKYDLRFFAYKDRVQLAIARLYQGQVTNLKARYGGFACVKFE